ncbi:unnamed protein product [Heligmosomoides polygyrus]|uniref:PDZ domain-containing protein n=1 Tax=Heligmosomoides polygyrus TaxID=6339 RepID=A0A183F5F9_HELPZ|nr:unnamed protein product [Heligmosomoides polygyrus]
MVARRARDNATKPLRLATHPKWLPQPLFPPPNRAHLHPPTAHDCPDAAERMRLTVKVPSEGRLLVGVGGKPPEFGEGVIAEPARPRSGKRAAGVW